MFAGLDVDSIVFDDAELERLFARDRAAASASGAKEDAAASTSGRISLLPMRRANNLSIVLSQFRMPPRDIAAAIAALDVNLPASGLVALAKLVPTDDEMLEVKRFIKDADEEAVMRLGDAEQFVAMALVLGSAMAEHVEVLVFRATLLPLLSEINAALRSVKNGCKALCDSATLKHLLAVTLSLGNRLNASNARGFRLDSLVKMRDTRMKGGKLTALHFVVDLALQHAGGDVPPWRDSMPDVFLSTGVSFADIAASLAQLERALETAAAVLDRQNSALVQSSFGGFMAEAASSLATTRSEFDSTRALFKQTTAFFGESDASEATDFFTLWCTFFKAFEQAVAELQHEKALAAKRSNNSSSSKQRRVIPVSPHRKGQKHRQQQQQQEQREHVQEQELLQSPPLSP